MSSIIKSVVKVTGNDQFERLNRSVHFKKGRFFNNITPKNPRFFPMLGEWLKGTSNTTPKNPIPVVLRNRLDFEQFPSSGLRTTWIGHSTTLVEIDGARLLIDPLFAKHASPFSFAGPARFYNLPVLLKDLPLIDAVLISHDHYDHLDKESVLYLSQKGYQFIVPPGVGGRLLGWGISSSQIKELDWWESAFVKDVTVTATPARHFSGRSLLMADRNKTFWCGFAVEGNIHRVYYSGDTGMSRDFEIIGKKLGPFDLALLEIGAYHRQWADFHLGPEQAVIAAKQVGAKLLQPVHWGTFNLAMHSWTEPVERLIEAAEKNSVNIVIPRPGESVDPSIPLEVKRWWPQIPWESAEKHPIAASGL